MEDSILLFLLRGYKSLRVLAHWTALRVDPLQLRLATPRESPVVGNSRAETQSPLQKLRLGANSYKTKPLFLLVANAHRNGQSQKKESVDVALASSPQTRIGE